MMPSGLTPAQRRAYLATLTDASYSAVAWLRVMDMQQRTLHTVHRRVVDGGITADATQELDRSLSLSLFDPERDLGLDRDDLLDDAALSAGRIVQTGITIDGRLLDEPVEVPTFTGIPNLIERVGDLIRVEGKDLGVVGMGAAWRSRTWPKGTRKTDVIIDLLTGVMGHDAAKIVIPDRRSRLNRELTLGRQGNPWPLARRLGRSMASHLGHRADGVPVLRRLPEQTSWDFVAHGDRSSIIGDVSVRKTTDSSINAAMVIGARPEGASTALIARGTLPRKHRLSPHRIGLNGVPRYLAKFEEDADIRCPEDTQARLDQLLREAGRAEVATAFTGLPIWHLEPMDLVGVEARETSIDMRLKQFTLPVVPTGGMSVGSTARIRAIRRR